MRPDTYGPDAYEADRRERDEYPPVSECAICGEPLWTADHICNDCIHVPCQKCNGEQVMVYNDGSHDEWVPCSCCDGEGYVSRSTAKRLKWKLVGIA